MTHWLFLFARVSMFARLRASTRTWVYLWHVWCSGNCTPTHMFLVLLYCALL